MTCLFNDLFAQVATSSLQGKVLKENATPAESSTIVLLKFKDSTIVSSTISNKTGLFKITGIQPGEYLLLVSAIGYNKSYTGPYNAMEGQTLNINDIILKPSTTNLKEVSVVSNRPDVEVRPGKVILNIQNNILAAGNSVFDILRQSPGVRVDDSNNISIVGRQKALITIDGKPTNLSGEDLAGILKGMQSNTIDYIELITNGSAKYDASGGGIINIVLKKGKNIGANATLTGSLGYGKYAKSNAGVVFNERTAKFNIFGNYNYSDDQNFHDFVTDRSVNFNNVVSNYNVDYNAVLKTNTNNFNLGTDFYLSPNSTVGFLINGGVRNENIVKDNNLQILNQGVLDTTVVAHSNVNRHITRLNYNLNYTGKLDKAGKTITADLNYSTVNRSSAEYIGNKFYNPAGNYYRDSLLQNLSPANIRIWVSKADFVDPISKTSKFEAGIKYSNVRTNNDLIFGPLVNGQYRGDPRFSNHFDYTENVNAGYVDYQNKFEKFDLTAGLRAEQTISKGNSITSGQVTNSNYTGLFPNVLLTYNYDDKHDFSFSYNRGILRPDYEALNPFLRYIDLYDFDSGNPNLKPQYTNSIELSYTYNKTFVTTLYSSIIANASEFKFFEQNDTSKVSVNIRSNLGTVYNYGIKFYAPVVFTSWWNADFNLDVSYQRYVAYPVNGNLNKGTQDLIFSTNQYFVLNKTLNATLTGHYETPTFYGISQFKAAYGVDAGIAKQLFNNRGSLKLSAVDIFNTVRDRFSINYKNLNLSTTSKVESQIVRLTFTYRLGKISVKNPTHHTGNEDEQKRTSSSNLP
ncbi:MAG: TonB-dependent receptor domain-containing protein [Sphingobacteriales bacterium]